MALRGEFCRSLTATLIAVDLFVSKYTAQTCKYINNFLTHAHMVISLEMGRFDFGLLLMFLVVAGKLVRVHLERAQLANFDLFEVPTSADCLSHSGTGEVLGTNTVAPFCLETIG